MRIDEAIRVTRELARELNDIANRAAVFNRNGVTARTSFEQAEALDTVCDMLEIERQRSKQVYIFDSLADSTGDGRNGTP